MGRASDWEGYPADVARWARSFSCPHAASQEIKKLAAEIGHVGPRRPPRGPRERHVLSQVQALDKQRYLIKRELRKLTAKVTLTYWGHRPVRTVGTCQESPSGTSVEVYGNSDRSVRAVLAKLSKQCDCARGWHDAA